jgi:hypothetical protein
VLRRGPDVKGGAIRISDDMLFELLHLERGKLDLAGAIVYRHPVAEHSPRAPAELRLILMGEDPRLPEWRLGEAAPEIRVTCRRREDGRIECELEKP